MSSYDPFFVTLCGRLIFKIRVNSRHSRFLSAFLGVLLFKNSFAVARAVFRVLGGLYFRLRVPLLRLDKRGGLEFNSSMKRLSWFIVVLALSLRLPAAENKVDFSKDI